MSVARSIKLSYARADADPVALRNSAKSAKGFSQTQDLGQLCTVGNKTAKKTQHVLLISYKLVYSSEQKSKDQKLSPTSGTYHSFELNANACEESTLSTYESSCPSQLNVLRHLLGKSINAQ